jgi:hypothetical protein
MPGKFIGNFSLLSTIRVWIMGISDNFCQSEKILSDRQIAFEEQSH